MQAKAEAFRASSSPDPLESRLRVLSIRRVEGKVTVYNFQVSIGTYVAGGLIMHNKEDCEQFIQYPPQ